MATIRSAVGGLAVVVLAAACAPAERLAQRTVPQVVDQWYELAETPGVVALVHEPGAATIAVARNRPDVAHPLGPDVPFRVGSVTKTFVSTVVLQLAAEGVVRLDDPVGRWVPEAGAHRHVTLRQLLGHTGGVPNYTESYDFEKDVHRWRTPVEALGFGVRQPPDFRAGTAIQYSNTGYLLLGLVVERVTGSTLGAVITERIVDPLGLTGTWLSDGREPAGAVASGFSDRDYDGRPEDMSAEPYPIASAAWAAGAMVSTAEDLVVFARALFGGELLPAAELELMTTPNPFDPPDHSYGLGVALGTPDGRTRRWGHGGSINGYRTGLAYLPDSGAVIVVLVSMDGELNPDDLVELLIRRRNAGG